MVEERAVKEFSLGLSTFCSFGLVGENIFESSLLFLFSVSF